MNALLLPGNSPRHEAWVEDLKTSLEPHFKKVTAQHYRHWQSGEELADVDGELAIAQHSTKDLAPYVTIAKSIGTAIAAKGTAEGKLAPTKLVLLGVPINGSVEPQVFASWLKNIDIPVIIIQNTSDPFGSFADIQSLCDTARTDVTLVEIPGDTHDYLDFVTIAKLAQ